MEPVKSFKDFVASDIEDVFTNVCEFAETAIIEGVEMSIVPDANVGLQGDKKNQVAAFDVVFHVAASYFIDAPQAEKIMNFNGKDYIIKSVDDNAGMYTIALVRNKS